MIIYSFNNNSIVIKFSQINSVSLLRGRPFKAERTTYNKTLDFIEKLPSKLDKDKISILIGHLPVTDISERQAVPLRKVSSPGNCNLM